MAPYKIILVRHGESIYNQENRFCGWHDADLSAQGVMEAEKAGKLILDKKLEFDLAYTSVLKRAIRTLDLILYSTNRCWVPVIK